jgi:hypothetical protein
VTGEHVLAAAQRHLHPEQLQVTIVGDPQVVRAPLEKLEMGPIALYDSEGFPLT